MGAPGGDITGYLTTCFFKKKASKNHPLRRHSATHYLLALMVKTVNARQTLVVEVDILEDMLVIVKMAAKMTFDPFLRVVRVTSAVLRNVIHWIDSE